MPAPASRPRRTLERPDRARTSEIVLTPKWLIGHIGPQHTMGEAMLDEDVLTVEIKGRQVGTLRQPVCREVAAKRLREGIAKHANAELPRRRLVVKCKGVPVGEGFIEHGRLRDFIWLAVCTLPHLSAATRRHLSDAQKPSIKQPAVLPPNRPATWTRGDPDLEWMLKTGGTLR